MLYALELGERVFSIHHEYESSRSQFFARLRISKLFLNERKQQLHQNGGSGGRHVTLLVDMWGSRKKRGKGISPGLREKFQRPRNALVKLFDWLLLKMFLVTHELTNSYHIACVSP